MLLIRLAFSCVMHHRFRGYLGGSVLEWFSTSNLLIGPEFQEAISEGL